MEHADGKCNFKNTGTVEEVIRYEDCSNLRKLQSICEECAKVLSKYDVEDFKLGLDGIKAKLKEYKTA